MRTPFRYYYFGPTDKELRLQQFRETDLGKPAKGLRVRPGTSSWITKFSQHEAD
jgi:hypothetical protein